MTDQPKDTSKTGDQSDKKKSETVQLTADDLRAISGGSQVGNPIVKPQVTEKVIAPKQ